MFEPTVQLHQRIRVATKLDAPAILRIYAPIVAQTPISFETEVPSVEEIENRIENTLLQYPWLVSEIDGKIVGYAYASQHRGRRAYQWSVEVTVYVDSDYHGTGIGKSLYQTLFKMLVKQGYFIAVAGVTLPNSGSIALHKSLGFRQVGVFGALGYKSGTWHDVSWWHLELQPLTTNPKDPVPFRLLALS